MTFSSNNLSQRSLTLMTFDPKSVEVTYVWLYLRIIVSKSHEITSKCVDTVTIFSKTWTKGHWPLDDFNPTSVEITCELYPRITVSKSHGNTFIYVDTVIKFAKYHIVIIDHSHNFGHCPVDLQVNGGNFQVQDYGFLTQEMKSTLNFSLAVSLENMFCFIFWPFFPPFWQANMSHD